MNEIKVNVVGAHLGKWETIIYDEDCPKELERSVRIVLVKNYGPSGKIYERKEEAITVAQAISEDLRCLGIEARVVIKENDFAANVSCESSEVI